MTARAQCTGVALGVIWFFACSSDAPSASLRQRGVQLGPATAVTAPQRAEPPRFEEPQRAESEPGGAQRAAEQPPSAADPNVAGAVEAPDKPQRSLQRELETMLGSPASCLQPRAAVNGASKLQISLSASIMPSGAVSRAEASGAGLHPDELKCLRDRIESLRFAEPIEGAPLTVTGSVTLEQAPTKAAVR
jgi:hypothetical protein